MLILIKDDFLSIIFVPKPVTIKACLGRQRPRIGSAPQTLQAAASSQKASNASSFRLELRHPVQRAKQVDFSNKPAVTYMS
jgi:hypothetical protein